MIIISILLSIIGIIVFMGFFVLWYVDTFIEEDM